MPVNPVATLPAASRTVAVIVWAVPAVTLAGSVVSASVVAAPGVTWIVAVLVFPEAVAVTVWLGTAFSARPVNAFWPATSAAAAGSVAPASDEVNDTDAVDPVARLSYAS